MAEYTNETLFEGIKNHTTFETVYVDSGFNTSGLGNDSGVGGGKVTIPKNAEANKAAWEKAYEEYGDRLGLRDKKAYLHFLGQIMHESGSFLYMEELASGKAYEGRKDLGNTEPGDGPRFKGRGPVQVTGRANYKKIYDKFFKPNGLGQYDIVNNPQLASDPYIGSLLTFGWALTTRNGELALRACNAYDVKAATKAINGGYNGLKDREHKTAALLLQNNLA